MQEESVVNKVREYFWMLDARQMQDILMRVIMKGQMRLAKISLSLPIGLQKKISANISKGARETLLEEIDILRSKITAEQQEEAAGFAVNLIDTMINDLDLHLPEMANTMTLVDGEPAALFKDPLITSRRIIESWILVTDEQRLADILTLAKSEMSDLYIDALESLSRDVRKYLLPYLAEEDYQVMINSFTKDTLNVLRPSQSINARETLSSYFERATAKTEYKRRDFVYQGAIKNPVWWQARMAWEKLFASLDDENLTNVLMSCTIDDAMLCHYESPLKIRERLFGLFGKEIVGILRYLYREMDFERLGEEAYQVRLKLIKEASNV